MKILIVDDSRAMQTIVRRGIEKLGYNNLEIRQASSGLEALDTIRVWEPHLVLSDWHMPEMTGLELLHKLNREMLGVPVGFITTETSEERKQEAIAAGARFFVQKPFDDARLHQSIQPILEGSVEVNTDFDKYKLDPVERKQIKLPDLQALNDIIRHFSQMPLTITPIESVILDDQQFPCLFGLYRTANEERVRAATIFDFNTSCILGGSMKTMETNIIQPAMNQKHISKPILANCKMLMVSLGKSLIERQTNQSLQLRSVNVIQHRAQSIDNLLQKPKEDRVNLQLNSEHYGTGRLMLISA